MGADENKALFIRYTDEVFTQGKHDLLYEYLDPGAVDHDPVPGSDGTIDALKAFLDRRRAAFPDFRYAIEDVIAEGDKVVVRATNTCAQESFLGIPAHGRRQTFTATFIHRIAAGKVLETWRNADDLGRLLQLGARIEPGTPQQ